MRKIQCLLIVLKRSYICYYMICMTILLRSARTPLHIVFLERYISQIVIFQILSKQCFNVQLYQQTVQICVQTKSRGLKRSWILPVSGKNKLRIIDVSRSNNLDVRAIVNVMFIDRTISIAKVPMRMRSSTFELTGVYFRGELNHFGHVGWQKISLGTKRAQKCLISICSFNSIL